MKLKEKTWFTSYLSKITCKIIEATAKDIICVQKRRRCTAVSTLLRFSSGKVLDLDWVSSWAVCPKITLYCCQVAIDTILH